MQYKQVISIFSETGLSPESLAEWIGVSNSTYRRWLKAVPSKEFPKDYMPNVSAGIYRLLSGGVLKYESARVNDFVEHNVPEYFSAALRAMGDAAAALPKAAPHEEKVVTVLFNLGYSAAARKTVDKALPEIEKFASWGPTWKRNIEMLAAVVKSDNFTFLEKQVAYGALFYLELPLDLIPDAIPVFGYIDDFGMLCAAAAHYSLKYPEKFKSA